MYDSWVGGLYYTFMTGFAHLSKARFTYQRPVSLIKGPFHLSKARFTYQRPVSLRSLIKGPFHFAHLSKARFTSLTYQRPVSLRSLIKGPFHLSKVIKYKNWLISTKISSRTLRISVSLAGSK